MSDISVWGILLAAVLVVLLLMAVTSGVRTYRRSLRHTEAHRRYLLANGATRLESVMCPSPSTLSIGTNS